MQFALRIGWVFAIGFFLTTSCNSKPEQGDDVAPEIITIQEVESSFDEKMTTLNAQCMVLRALKMGGSNRMYYLLNICPEVVTANHQAINIAPPDEPSVTAYLDTIRSFPNEERARAYAEANGIFDIYFEPSK